MNIICWLLHMHNGHIMLAAPYNIYESEQQWALTLPAGERVRLRAGLLRVGVLRRCLSRMGEAARRRGGERGRRPLGDTGLQQCQSSFKHCLLT